MFKMPVFQWLGHAAASLAAGVCLFVGLPQAAHAQATPDSGAILWRTDLELAMLEAQETGKKVLVDLHVDWCQWCYLMQQKAYSDPRVRAYINQKFIPVRLEAETEDSLRYGRTWYHYMPKERVNGLAYLLMREKVRYPCTAILLPDGQIVQVVHGYLEPQWAYDVFRFFGNNSYIDIDWNIFINRYPQLNSDAPDAFTDDYGVDGGREEEPPR